MQSLPALIKLCDDPSPVVSGKVAQRLRELGSGVWDEIKSQKIRLSASQREVLESIFVAHDDETLREAWLWLSSHSNEHRYLESALLALCDWQTGTQSGAKGRLLLDELAVQFGDFEFDADQTSDAAALARFLFEEKGLLGAEPDDYYNPLHSNLVYTLESGRGLPITLACIFILVGRRVGLEIEGCPFPGHFLARDGQSEQVFDPYNGGRPLSRGEVEILIRAAPQEMNGPASAHEIVTRVLRNLSMAYHHSGDGAKSSLMLSLLRIMDDD